MGTPGKAIGGIWLRLVLLTLSLSAAAYAQSDMAWLFTYPNSEPLAFFADDSGNVYVAGWSEKEPESSDVLLLKVDSLGHLVRDRTYDDVTAVGAARDTSGNIYIAGSSTDTAEGRLYVLKYTPSGNLECDRSYGEAHRRFGSLGSIAIDDSQNVYACGRAESASCGIVRILKYRPNGVLASVMSYATGSPAYFWWGRFHIVSDGGAYLAITMQRRTKSSALHLLVAKLSSQGRVLWKKVSGDTDSTYEDIRWSQIDGNDNTYVTGQATNPDGFRTVKMDSSGEMVWTGIYPKPGHSDGGDDFLLLHKGNVYVASGMDTIRLVKYDSLGRQLWLSKYPDPADTSRVEWECALGYGQGHDEPWPDFCCMSVDDSGNVYLTGHGLTEYGTGNGRRDYSIFAFMLKYDPQGKLVWTKKRPWRSERPDGGLDVTWSGAMVGLDRKGALYDIGIGGASAERGIYVLKYRTR